MCARLGPLGFTNRHLGGVRGCGPAPCSSGSHTRPECLRATPAAADGAFGLAEVCACYRASIHSAVPTTWGPACCLQGIWIDRTTGFCLAWNGSSGQTMAQTRHFHTHGTRNLPWACTRRGPPLGSANALAKTQQAPSPRANPPGASIPGAWKCPRGASSRARVAFPRHGTHDMRGLRPN